MSEVLAAQPPLQRRRPLFLRSISESAPSLREVGLASSSAILLILSFPNFDLWWLAWIGLVPLLFAVATTSRKRTAFVLGLMWGTIFFYGTCWWLTYPMIHFGGVAPWLAYPLALLPVIFVSIFPALACACISHVVKRFGTSALAGTPLIWVAFDWLRCAVTGLDWNTLGYSQAFHPLLIQTASKGGVYAVTFLLVATNIAIVLFVLKRRRLAIICFVALLITTVMLSYGSHSGSLKGVAADVAVVAIQPNVPMDRSGDTGEMQILLERHLALSASGLGEFRTRYRSGDLPVLLIWPESPMNFSYSGDAQLQKVLASFAQANRVSVLLNSLEPAPNGGSYNSAILINEQGHKIAQYDKIRLMPFGEYVPLPRWLPGSGSVRSIVGEFTPGSSHTLMPLGAVRAGVFICIEAAHADVARSFTNAGADVLINISNDGYLGPTAVMRQHLANASFRAVENDRDLVRVTNSGISAYIDSNGNVRDTTSSFREAVRTWTVSKTATGSTFYSRHGDVFAYGCALITLGFISATFMTRRKGTHASGLLGN
jgi:apolipoprotein N-acyltransferase